MLDREQDNFAEKAARIRQLNDELRTIGRGGLVMMTIGVQRLGVIHHAEIMHAIRSFDAFNEDNDPHGEHDFGALDLAGQRLFWKIDYYDLDLMMGSPDPADPNLTCRVLTIMLASEY
jgi:Protein of unknown function (DUF3768)